MTRPQGFDVRVAPEVLARYEGRSKGARRSRDARSFADAMERLRREGTRATGAKKLKGFDLWEIRADDQRAFFRPVPRSNRIAVGYVLTKTTRRLWSSRLRHIERIVGQWCDALEGSR